jgi:hypothetical protein
MFFWWEVLFEFPRENQDNQFVLQLAPDRGVGNRSILELEWVCNGQIVDLISWSSFRFQGMWKSACCKWHLLATFKPFGVAWNTSIRVGIQR